jgi:hypothetical protein
LPFHLHWTLILLLLQPPIFSLCFALQAKVLITFYFPGLIVLGSNGTTERIELKQAEEIYVDPAFLVAYDSCLNPSPPLLDKLTIPVLYPASSKDMGAFFTKDGQRERLILVGKWVREALRVRTINSWRGVKRWSVGDKAMYRIEGPGVAYLSSKRV